VETTKCVEADIYVADTVRGIVTLRVACGADVAGIPRCCLAACSAQVLPFSVSVSVSVSARSYSRTWDSHSRRSAEIYPHAILDRGLANGDLSASRAKKPEPRRPSSISLPSFCRNLLELGLASQTAPDRSGYMSRARPRSGNRGRSNTPLGPRPGTLGPLLHSTVGWTGDLAASRASA
jgi:hypothetical protein